MKKMNKSIVTLLAVTIAGLFLILAVNRFKSFDRSVSVRGLCEREVKADLAIYPISFSTGGDNLSVVNGDVQAKNQLIIDFLKQNGFEDSEISVSVPSISDNTLNAYRTPNTPNYSISSTITLYTKKIDQVLAIQNKFSDLVAHGIAINVSEWSVTYEFTGLNDIKPEMIASANQSAREAANQFAKDSHSRVGKIKDAQQGLFSIENRDGNTPYIKKVRVVTYVTYYLR